MASYRLHVWVGAASGLRVPPLGAWAPTLHLRCGVAEARSQPEDVLMYEAEGKGCPVFQYYMRVPVVSPLDKDVVVSVLNAKAIGKGKLGSVVVPIKALIRGVPIGFRWFKLLNKKGKRVGNVYMRVMVQYPETVTLPPNPMSREALKPFKHRGASTLLKLGVHQLEGVAAPNGLKLNLLNKNTKIQALYPKVEEGMDLDDHFWLDLHRKTVSLVFKVRRLASWVKVGTCFVDVVNYNSGEKEAHWHKILDKQDMVVGRVMLAVQMQFYHSVLLPPDCPLRLAEEYQEQIFATRSTLALIRHLEESRAQHERQRAAEDPDHDAAGLPIVPLEGMRDRRRAASGGGPAAVAGVVVQPLPPPQAQNQEHGSSHRPLPHAESSLSESSVAAASSGAAVAAAAMAAAASSGAAHPVRRKASSHLEDAAEEAAREEMLMLERALEESRLQFEREQSIREQRESLHRLGEHMSPAVPRGGGGHDAHDDDGAAEAAAAAAAASPHASAYGASAVAVSLDPSQPAVAMQRYPSRGEFIESSDEAEEAAAAANRGSPEVAQELYLEDDSFSGSGDSHDEDEGYRRGRARAVAVPAAASRDGGGGAEAAPVGRRLSPRDLPSPPNASPASIRRQLSHASQPTVATHGAGAGGGPAEADDDGPARAASGSPPARQAVAVAVAVAVPAAAAAAAAVSGSGGSSASAAAARSPPAATSAVGAPARSESEGGSRAGSQRTSPIRRNSSHADMGRDLFQQSMEADAEDAGDAAHAADANDSGAAAGPNPADAGPAGAAPARAITVSLPGNLASSQAAHAAAQQQSPAAAGGGSGDSNGGDGDGGGDDDDDGDDDDSDSDEQGGLTAPPSRWDLHAAAAAEGGASNGDKQPAASTPAAATPSGLHQGVASLVDLHAAAAAEVAAGSEAEEEGGGGDGGGVGSSGDDDREYDDDDDAEYALSASARGGDRAPAGAPVGEREGLEGAAANGAAEGRTSPVEAARERIRARLAMRGRKRDDDGGVGDFAAAAAAGSESAQSTPHARPRYEVEDIPDVLNSDQDDSDTYTVDDSSDNNSTGGGGAVHAVEPAYLRAID